MHEILANNGRDDGHETEKGSMEPRTFLSPDGERSGFLFFSSPGHGQCPVRHLHGWPLLMGAANCSDHICRGISELLCYREYVVRSEMRGACITITR